MKLEEFLNIQDDQKVILVDNDYHKGDLDVGAVMVRHLSWLDDEHGIGFSFTNNHGEEDWHFFGPDEIELIKE